MFAPNGSRRRRAPREIIVRAALTGINDAPVAARSVHLGRCIMQNQTTDSAANTSLATIYESIARWVRRYRESLDNSRQLAQCGPDEVAAMAQDLMISPSDLMALAGKSPDSARLLYRLLSALGVDPAALGARDPMVMRDLERLCVTCSHKRQCTHDLAAGTGAAHYKDYCPNAYTLDMLVAAQPAPSNTAR
jgi:hypothetical protein